MKKLYSVIIALFVAQFSFAQWPANYDGVMLQGFYWDSYEDTQWANLTSQADELSKFFDLIWVPNSANCRQQQSMGYMPVYWFQPNSSFGRPRQLRDMIAAFKERGTGIIEDVVLNHKAPLGQDGSYIDFVNETWTWEDSTYQINWSGADICNNDDGGYIKSLGFDVTGADDTGEDFSGARDLDHTSANVQNNCKIYLNYLLKDLGYAGFRLDMVKGYGAEYTKMYNQASNPEFCVGEYWDSYENITNWVKNTGYTSAAFDFPLKFILNSAFAGGDFTALNSKGIAGDPNNNRYAVTFVDNHDTEDESYRCQANQLGATAFILGMPGTPCVFLKHWKKWSREIGNMILARKAAGLTNQSAIETQQVVNNGYVIKTKGTNGSVMVLCGDVGSYDTTGFNLISQGGAYAYYVSDNVTVEGLDYTEPEKKDFKVYVYAEKAPNLYAWDNYNNVVNGEWPGTQMTETTTTPNGTEWFAATINTASLNLILNNGTKQTKNIEDLTEETYIYYNGKTSYEIVDSTFSAADVPEESDITVYVSATTAPYLYAWNDGGSLNGEWPGTQLTETATTSDGKTWWTITFDPEVTTVNIIFNDGNGNQTADITGITADSYYTYDGATKYEDVTYEYVPYELPDCATYVEDALFVYFEATSDYPTPYVWAWNADGNVTGSEWPGNGVMTNVGTAKNGNSVWRYIFTAEPTGLLFSNAGSPQTADFAFTNGGYYTVDGQRGVVKPSTGIKGVEVETVDANAPRYNLAGQRVGRDYRGIVIVNGKKVVNF